MVMEGVKDARAEMGKVGQAEPHRRAEVRQALLGGGLPRWLGYFERLLAATEGSEGFFVGGGVTCADLSVWHLLEGLTENDLFGSFIEHMGRCLYGGVFEPSHPTADARGLTVDALGWLDTLLVIVVPSAASAFGVFFLRQFFLSLPREIEEAALLDGATHAQVFTRIVLPLSKPPLATLAVLSFLTNWNDFLWPIYVLFSADLLTLPPGLGALQGAYVTDYPVIMAGAALASIPALVLFIIAQRYIIEGVSRTGLKG
jgi:hypothetical protein